MMVPGIRHATATQAYEESVVNLQQWIDTAFPGELTKRSPEEVSMFKRHSAHTRYSWITVMDDSQVIKAHKMSDAMFSYLVETYQLTMNNAYLTISVLLRDSNYNLARGDEQPFTYPFEDAKLSGGQAYGWEFLVNILCPTLQNRDPDDLPQDILQ